MPTPERVSIRDLAKIAGVSRTTVSLALRNSSEVSTAMREKIKELARKHDYRSHPAVNALMQQVGRKRRVHDEEVIAFVRTGSSPEEKALGPLEILAGARTEAHRLGFRVEVFWAGFCGVDSMRLARVLYQRGIRGVVWGPMPYPHPPLRFPWHQFVPIACTLSTEVKNLPTVHIHHANGMATVLAELQARGARRIGVVLDRYMEVRQDFGWTQGVDLHRSRTDSKGVFMLVLAEAANQTKIMSWVRRMKIDTLVMSSDIFMMTEGLKGTIARASLDVPSSEIGNAAGLHQNMELIGRLTISSLAVRLYGDTPGLPSQSISTVVNGSFVDGESLRPLVGNTRA